MPMYELSYLPYNNGMKAYTPFAVEVENFNSAHALRCPLRITCNAQSLDEHASERYFALTDSLSLRIDAAPTATSRAPLLLQRAVAYSVMQNFEAAIGDLTDALQTDSLSSLVHWHLAVCQTMLNNFNASKGADVRLNAAKALSFFDRSLALNPQNAYVYYDRGNLYAALKDTRKAVADYTEAIRHNPTLAEAYYNRGLLQLQTGNKAAGIADLSKAGELGLYKAYSIIKQEKTQTK